jgi:hypothetical protein
LSVDADLGRFFHRAHHDVTIASLVALHERMREVNRVIGSRRRNGLREVVTHPLRFQGRDHIERRDPDAVEAWIRRGPR